MGVAGVAWHTFGGERASGQVAFGQASVADKAELRFSTADERALISIDGALPLTVAEFGASRPVECAVPVVRRRRGYARRGVAALIGSK
jgi:hypothetical protein